MVFNRRSQKSSPGPRRVGRMYKFFHIHDPSSSLDQRVSYLEGFRNAWHWVFTSIAAILGLLAAAVVYQSFVASIDKTVRDAVASEVVTYSTAIADSAATSVAARNEVVGAAAEALAVLRPTQTPSPTTADAQLALRSYFDAINNGEYAHAWTMLTEGFKVRSGQTELSTYLGFWTTVASVELLEASLSARTDSYADFAIRVRWHPRQGSAYEAAYLYRLVFDPTMARWMIESAKDL